MKRSVPDEAWSAPSSETRRKLVAGEYPAGVVVVTEFEDQTYWGWGCPECGAHDYAGRSPRKRVRRAYREHRGECGSRVSFPEQGNGSAGRE